MYSKYLWRLAGILRHVCCLGFLFISIPLHATDQPGTDASLLLVKDGQATGEFVVAEDISQAETFAVTDVRLWIQKITGAQVPILNAPSAKQNAKVFVGKNLAAEFKEDLSKLSENDGFAIRRKGRSVYVFGARPRATMYGLFAFLEKNSDLIWARPNERFGTVFGRAKDFPLTDTDCLDIPVFNYRSLGGGFPPHAATGEWQLRNRNNQCGRLYGPEMDMVNIAGRGLAGPIAGLFQEHPEYFAYYPAIKARKGVSGGEGSMCITRPGLPEIWARECLKIVGEKEKQTATKVKYFTIGPGDNWYCCQCPECIKPIPLPDGTVLEMKDPSAEKDPVFRSTQIFRFLNEAMKTWEKERPDVELVALAYIHMAEPPLVKLHPKLRIQFAPYADNSMHFPLLDARQPSRWRERFEKWLHMTDTLGFYEYWFSKPSPQGFYAAENLRALLPLPNSRNAFLFSHFDNDCFNPLEGGNMIGWDLGGMNPWVIARLFWDPTQDVDGLYRYYIKRAFREAAPQMTEYYELIKASWLDPEDQTMDSCHMGMKSLYNQMILKKKLEPKLFNILARAEAAAQNPDSKRLIKRMREGFSSFSQAIIRLSVADIPEMELDGDSFESVQWGKPDVLGDFKVLPATHIGAAKLPSQETRIKAAHDGTNLYLRVTALDSKISSINTVQTEAQAEIFPKGDHIEFWLGGTNGGFLFAFDANGAKYDAKNLDRSWNSGWRLNVKKTDAGYEGIAVIPLASVGLVPKQETKLGWFCAREINHKDEVPEEATYGGSVLNRTFYPIVFP